MILSSFKGKKLVVTGDFNAKSPIWCLNSSESCSKGRLLMEILEKYKLVCINNGEATRFPKNQFFKASSIDLVFCSTSLSNKSVFSIDSDLSSDHRPIIISFRGCILKARKLKEFWNFKKADSEKFKKVCTEYFSNFLNQYEASSLDLLVEKCSSILLTAAKISVPLVKESQYQPNKWWTKQIKKLVKTRKRLRKK